MWRERKKRHDDYMKILETQKQRKERDNVRELSEENGRG